MRDAPWCVVVMPCLNEAECLLETCKSLGFGASSPPPNSCHLVLVDNGSSDGTYELCVTLREVVGGSVVVARELDRGHVPARRLGTTIAGELAVRDGVPPDEAVIVQADADTYYSPNYVDHLRVAVETSGDDAVLAQAVTLMDPAVEQTHPALFAEMRLVDTKVEERFPPHPCDVLVDDKACAYTLRRYQQWGGHRREFFPDREELLAETSRMFVAGRSFGAVRLDVSTASATHSQRRLIDDAAENLATGGFPYARRRVLTTASPVGLDTFEEQLSRGDDRLMTMVRFWRMAHLIALTVVLPAHLANTFWNEQASDEGIARVVAALPQRSREIAVTSPGVFLADVLQLLKNQSVSFDDLQAEI